MHVCLHPTVVCFQWELDRFSCGNSSWSFCLMPATPSSFAGRTWLASSACWTLMRWLDDGASGKTRPTWTTTRWGARFAITTTRWSWRRCRASGSLTSSIWRACCDSVRLNQAQTLKTRTHTPYSSSDFPAPTHTLKPGRYLPPLRCRCAWRHWRTLHDVTSDEHTRFSSAIFI